MRLQMSLLRIKDGSPMSVGDIVGSVESVEGKVWDACSAFAHGQECCFGCYTMQVFCVRIRHVSYANTVYVNSPQLHHSS